MFVVLCASLTLGGCWPFSDDSNRGGSEGIEPLRVWQVTGPGLTGTSLPPREVTLTDPIEVYFGEPVTLLVEVVVTGNDRPVGSRNVELEVFVNNDLAFRQVSNGSASAASNGRISSTRLFDVTIEVNDRSIDYAVGNPSILIEASYAHNGDSLRAGFGFVGYGIDVSRRPYPIGEPILTGVSAGGKHLLARDASGAVWAWGSNDQRQIDNFFNVPATEPTRVDIAGTVVDFAAGLTHSVAVDSANRIWTWGSGFLNGDGRPGSRNILVEDPNAGMFGRSMEISAVFAGTGASYVIGEDDELYAWGDNESGRLGLDTSEEVIAPTLVPIGPVTKVATGAEHVLALTPDGQVWGWGESASGQLGLDSQATDSAIRLPVQISDVTGIADIAATQDSSVLVTTAGQLLLLGGDLGFDTVGAIGSTNYRVVSGINDATAVEANILGGSLLITRQRSTGEIYYSVFGANEFGQLTVTQSQPVGEPSDAAIPKISPAQISLGGRNGVLLQQDGGCSAVWSWGSSLDGGLGRPNISPGISDGPAPLSQLGAANCTLLTVDVDNGGAISSQPGNIQCGNECDDSFAPGTNVTLDATQLAQSFAGFRGHCSLPDGTLDTALPALVVMDGHKYCPATFGGPSGFIAPVAAFTTTPASPVDVGTSVTFDGSASFDLDGNVISWSWDLDGNGTIDANGELVSFVYPTAGPRVVSLTVADNDGQADTTSATIDVASMLSAPPVAAFTIQPSATQPLGSLFTFDASLSTDDVGIVLYEWDLENDGIFDSTGIMATASPPAAGVYDVRLRVTDADGQFAEAINSITVTSGSSGGSQFTLRMIINGPGQLDIPNVGGPYPDSSCDGNECFVTVDEGTALSIDAAPFTPAAFLGWSAMDCDSIPSSNRCVVTMTADRTVTATFQ